MPKKFKLPKNSDTCLVIKNTDGSYKVHRYINGLIDIARYTIDNNIVWRSAILFDNLYSIDIEDASIYFGMGDYDSSSMIGYENLIQANQVYDFCLKNYSVYKTGKSSTSTKPKKKPLSSKVASKLYPVLHEAFSIPEPPSLDRPLIDL